MDWRGIFATIVITLFLSTILIKAGVFNTQSEMVRVNREISILDKKIQDQAGGWIHYLETRFNGLSLRQDEYQNSTTIRVDKQDERLRRLEEIIARTYDHKNNIYSVKPPKDVAPLIKETTKESQNNN